MSRLVLNGNTTKLLGTYLPAPYIEKIVLEGDNQLTIKSGVIVRDKPEVVLYNDGELVNDEVVQKQNLNDLFYYRMIFLASERAGAFPAEDSPIFYYNEIINGNLNPFEFFYTSGSAINQTQIEGKQVFATRLTTINASSDLGDASEVYDTDGNLFFSYPYEVTSDLQFNWDEIQDLRVITFTSTYEYNESKFEEEESSNISFLDIKTSDITYEPIIENGELADPYKVLFFDQEGQLYNETPLLSIDLTPYKVNNVTSEDIVVYFKALLEDYREQYESDTGFRDLKNVMNNIYKTLELKRYDSGLVVALNNIAISFPDKTPIRPVGKLYKRFRNRIFTVNNQIKNSEQLNRRKIYDSKIFDNIPKEPDVEEESLFIQGTKQDNIVYYSTENGLTAEFLYKDWTANIYTNGDLADEDKDIVFGTFFFDYEKAVRKTSTISRVYGVEKLNTLGMYVPWDKFRVVLARTSRYSPLLQPPDSGTTRRPDAFDTHIYSYFDETKNYPMTKNVFLYEEKLDNSVLGQNNHFALTPASDEWGALPARWKDFTEAQKLDLFFNFLREYLFSQFDNYCGAFVDLGLGEKESLLQEFFSGWNDLAVGLYTDTSNTLSNLLREWYELSVGLFGVETEDSTRDIREQSATEKCSSLLDDAQSVGHERISDIENNLYEYNLSNGIFQNPYMANREDPGDETTYNENYDALNSCATSLVFRQFADLSKVENNYGIDQSGINNYRAMMFQLLDYRVNDFGENNYNARVYIQDDTHELVNHMTASCRIAYNEFAEYRDYARENCSYNNNREVFNDFFSDAMNQVYGNQPRNFPWYKGPVLFYTHLDLLSNTFNGDASEIKKAVQNLQAQLNPSTGNIEAIEQFYEDFKNLINTNYGASAGETEGTTLGNLVTRYCCYTEYLNPIS
jgi:DNA-directed RNA polymerase subunit N (RpoN/RPB10)